MRKLFILALLFFSALVVIGTLSAPGSTGGRQITSSVGPADQATLQQDAAMTQVMSAPTVSGPMQAYGTVDPQLGRSQNPAFVRQLERYQNEIDRMLGRPPR